VILFKILALYNHLLTYLLNSMMIGTLALGGWSVAFDTAKKDPGGGHVPF